ncbi:hypothetical protein ACIGZJ_31005 [Kitasatospora sp. NPDC052868]|uniref:hypothetical protein n=1 Tax=Kitasatospora sp. NPDC052868 TaxID=3364060 RepID=UPI0037CA6C76
MDTPAAPQPEPAPHRVEPGRPPSTTSGAAGNPQPDTPTAPAAGTAPDPGPGPAADPAGATAADPDTTSEPATATTDTTAPDTGTALCTLRPTLRLLEAAGTDMAALHRDARRLRTERPRHRTTPTTPALRPAVGGER